VIYLKLKTMGNITSSKLNLIKVVLWSTIAFSFLALIYHTRWFISFLINDSSFIVPTNQAPSIWFITQITNNLIFLYVGYLLVRLIRRYKLTGFFDETSFKVLDGMILSSVVLATLGAIQVLFNNFYEVHISEWKSLESSLNLLFRSFTKLLVFESPQTMYFILAIFLWIVKQFVTRALFIKNENESFI